MPPADLSGPAQLSDGPAARRSPVRWLLAALGVSCFALAVVGAILPGLPTTVFLLAGSYLLTRSCPWLERRLLAMPPLRPYGKYLDPSVPMPWRVKQRAIAAMWLSISVAVVLMIWRGTVPVFVVVAVLVAGVAGTAVVLRFRRAPALSPDGGRQV